MTKFNRGELLDKAFKGEIKTGDVFERVNCGDKIRFDGRYFRWTNGNAIVEMQVMEKGELFEKFEEKIKLELNQLEVNTLALMMGRSSQNEREEKFERHRQITGKITEICKAPQAYALFEKLDALVK